MFANNVGGVLLLGAVRGGRHRRVAHAKLAYLGKDQGLQLQHSCRRIVHKDRAALRFARQQVAQWRKRTMQVSEIRVAGLTEWRSCPRGILCLRW